MNHKLNIKSLVLSKFEKTLKDKYKLLKTDTIYFDSKSDIEFVTCSDGYNIFYKKHGGRIYPISISGKLILSLLDCLIDNNFYSYYNINDTKCKVRPKKQR